MLTYPNDSHSFVGSVRLQDSGLRCLHVHNEHRKYCVLNIALHVFSTKQSPLCRRGRFLVPRMLHYSLEFPGQITLCLSNCTPLLIEISMDFFDVIFVRPVTGTIPKLHRIAIEMKPFTSHCSAYATIQDNRVRKLIVFRSRWIALLCSVFPNVQKVIQF